MQDAQLTAVLHGLGIDHDTRAALALLPLVQVAWADGTVQEAERSLILQVAADRGLVDEESMRLLQSWLRYRPSQRYMERGRLALVELARRGGETLPPGTLDDIVSLCQEVARSAGGLFLGFGSVQAAERSVLSELAEALDIDQGADWHDIFDDLGGGSVDEDLPDEVTDVGGFVIEGLADVDADTLTGEEGSPPQAQVVGRSPDGEQSLAWPLPTRAVTIGRRSDSDIHLRWDKEVSRQHCLLRPQRGRWYVVDAGTINGTRVDGELVLERRLLGGERITVGQTDLRFEVLGGAA